MLCYVNTQKFSKIIISLVLFIHYAIKYNLYFLVFSSLPVLTGQQTTGVSTSSNPHNVGKICSLIRGTGMGHFLAFRHHPFLPSFVVHCRYSAGLKSSNIISVSANKKILRQPTKDV